MARVSIAIPAYNVEKFIGQSIESLLGQTYGDLEVVISDNASTDSTEEICRGYAARDKRVRYVRRDTNIGGPGNFRYVFSLCSGEYHKWSTADDYWHKDFVARAVTVLDANRDVVLCYPKTRLITMAGEPIEDYADNLHLTEESASARFGGLIDRIALCNAHLGVIRRAAMQQTRLIAAHKSSDIDFLAELALYGKFWLLPEVMFFRRFHPTSSSWARDSDEHQRRYYDPGHQYNFAMHTWKKYGFLASAIWRAPIGIGEKLRCAVRLQRMMRWDRTALSRELRARYLTDTRASSAAGAG